MSVKTTFFGYPRIDPNRELKRILEDYWSGKCSREDLFKNSDALIVSNAKTIYSHGIDLIPSNEFSLYDFILDHSVMFGAVHERFYKLKDPLD